MKFTYPNDARPIELSSRKAGADVHTKSKVGVAFLLSGLLLPIIARIGGQIYNANVASYGGPPDQGAMVLAYLAFLLSAIVGCLLALAGLTLVIVSQVYPKPRLPQTN